MSEFEDLETDRKFAAIMAENNFATDSTASFGLELVMQGSLRVGLDRDTGEELHKLLASAQDDAEEAIARDGMELAKSSVVSNRMRTVLNMAAAYCEVGEPNKNVYAVDGFGWFGVKDPDKSWGMELETLNPGERIFGRIGSAAFDYYHHIDQSIIDKLRSTGERPSKTLTLGGLITLNDARIWGGDKEGCGVIDRTFETAFVPVKIDTFQWARVYKL